MKAAEKALDDQLAELKADLTDKDLRAAAKSGRYVLNLDLVARTSYLAARVRPHKQDTGYVRVSDEYRNQMSLSVFAGYHGNKPHKFL